MAVADNIKIDKAQLKSLVYDIMKEMKASQNGQADSSPRLSKADYEALMKLLNKSKSKKQRNNYDYDRKMDLLERIIRLEEGQIRIEEKMDTRFDDMNKRFDDMNKRFDDFNKRFEDMNKRFNTFLWIVSAGFAFLSLLIVLLKLFS